MPQNWKTYKLGDLSNITMGQSPKGINTNKSGKGLPLLNGPTEFGYSQPTPTQYTTDPKRISNSGDLLFCVRGSTTGRMNYSNIPYAIGRGLCSFTGSNGYSTRYIKYLIDYELSNLLNITTGSTFPNLSKNDINQFSVKSPNYKEANKIAQILSAIDDKIENNLAINKTLEEMAMALYKHWFVDFGPFQDGAFVESELGEIPEGWEVKRLDDVSVIFAGGDKPKEFSKEQNEEFNIPIYSNGVSNEGLYGYTDEARIFEESVTVSARGTIGFVCLRMQPYLPIVRLISVVPNSEYISSKFLYLCLQTLNIQGNGTTQQQLTVPDFKETKIIIPDIDLVNKFTDIADLAYKKIFSNKEENQTLTKLRDTLLPKLISGEVRLKEFQEQTAAIL